MRTTLSIAGVAAFIFLLATIPFSITITEGNLVIDFQVILFYVKDYVASIGNGEIFHYQVGKSGTYNLLADLPPYFLTSLQYLTLSGFITICMSMLVSAWSSKSKREWVKDIIGFLGTLPDFILILFLQLGVVFIYQSTGFKIAKVASRSADENAFLLPLITLTLIPTIYLIRTLSERTYDVLAEDYILSAKAKGLKKRHIYMHHVIRNVLPYLKADLHKVIAIMMSNLFIVEYLFNVRGLTTLLFGGTMYQYNLVVNTLFSLVLLYLLIYWLLRLLILIMERVFAHG
ncbi:ABC transporter permease subunit [Ornithinibacillus bavariensis]|uniref:Peptide ABC transporter permease n=1 Tax=Ornithinibacillus bavariensis TaxID=545502 RepID=A0A920C5Q5_9BACI|nr:ABC transporter permease subunit [Ornithinibacillus bavariensis]GIO25798.1 peptide ABC transporter permease [Ornithinibacillus bavariensis]